MHTQEKTNYLRYFILLLRPTLIGLSGLTLWYFTHEYISVEKTDQGIFESIIGAFVNIHVLIASFQIIKVVGQYNKITQAIHTKNKVLFEENICLRINPGIKFLLGVCSGIIYLLFLIYPYTTTYAGVFTTGFVLFILALLWEVASELDDPYNGISKIKREEVDKAFPKEPVREVSVEEKILEPSVQ